MLPSGKGMARKKGTFAEPDSLPPTWSHTDAHAHPEVSSHCSTVIGIAAFKTIQLGASRDFLELVSIPCFTRFVISGFLAIFLPESRI